MKHTLTGANREMYRRSADECFPSLDALRTHCHDQKERSHDQWAKPQHIRVEPGDGSLGLTIDDAAPLGLNSWSFSQLCQLAGVSRDTVNRLTPATASSVFAETMPTDGKPIQLYTLDQNVRSVHGASYTRLHNAELLSMAMEFATDFVPPQRAGAPGDNGPSGLYCGEQDMFVFLIDPTGWTEIAGEAFAPGFFLWNSEVGKRSLGIQTFWFQAVCRNHIVWDAVEVMEFSRKHTASVHDGLREIRSLINKLVDRRDERRDAFASVIAKAMNTSLGDDEKEVLKVLAKHGVTRSLAKEALDTARVSGRFTIFSMVDALTRAAKCIVNAGDRTEADQSASSLLALAR